ncbi:hypothetical protein [Reichenbachiella versicolor]|uniref:hypothetical protein n=1 Tax=Reichenbachiella versicolor TaxID=1821036 RepID=UPI000D6EAFB6|nr:hypothetical protein [Reichenbachiella versicolor]
MTRVILTALVMVLVLNVASAQSKIENQAKFYTEKMAEKFDISKKDQKKFYEARVELSKTSAEFWMKKKNGEFASDEEYKKAQQKATGPYFDKLIELTGAKSNEFWKYNREIMPEVKKIK